MVGVAHVDGAHLSHRAAALHRTLFDANLLLGQVADDLFQRRGGDEADIAGAAGGVRGLGRKLVPALVQFDHLLAKRQRLAPALDDQLQAQDLGVKVHGDVNIGNGQNQVVE